MDRTELTRFIKSNSKLSAREILMIVAEACGCSGVSLYQSYAAKDVKQKFLDAKIVDKNGRMQLYKLSEFIRMMIEEDMLAETKSGAVFRKFRSQKKN
ncbi:MAG: hypothetical protein C0602_08490 [Denitrovibrio sp.]|nr:MAG: hypothetical protein C0602_08490 [Denitrovibrio sp.]